MAGPYSIGDEPVPGYRLVKFLGRGGFGEVWQARTPGQAECALKFIRLKDKQGYKEFRAIRLVKLLRHPHLVPIQAFWLKEESGQLLEDSQEEDSLWLRDKDVELIIAMGLGDKNLFDRLRECRAAGKQGIPVEELLEYMTAAAKAIDFLNQPTHDLGSGPISIQHCDIKPQNILIVGGEVQVCDFGLARPLNEARKTSTAAGSYAYIAPELIHCRPSRSSDQYSLAISYVELRTGSLPFATDSLYQVMMAHLQGQLDFSRLPEAEQTVLRRATALEPNARYPTTLEMVKALRRAVEGSSPSKPSGSGTPRVPGVWQAGEYVGLGYKLVRPLGRGGYGEVWEATAPGGIPVAVKIISNMEAVEGKQEFKALELIKSVKHNHLMELHAYWLLDAHDQVVLEDSHSWNDGSAARKLIIATKLADKNLLQRLQECRRAAGVDGGIPLDELLGYMRQAAQAIDYLNTPQHPLGSRRVSIQHRDIKPENILLAGGIVKVGDFGLAKVLEGSCAVIRSQSAGLTLAYAAPETFDGRVTAWSDQYALAITYFHLRTGRMPFSASSYTEIIRVHVEGKLDLSALPVAERPVIARATALNPHDRFPNCQALVEALESTRTPAEKASCLPSTSLLAASPAAQSTELAGQHRTPSAEPASLGPLPGSVDEPSSQERPSGKDTVTPANTSSPATSEPALDPYTTVTAPTPLPPPGQEVHEETQADAAALTEADQSFPGSPHLGRPPGQAAAEKAPGIDHDPAAPVAPRQTAARQFSPAPGAAAQTVEPSGLPGWWPGTPPGGTGSSFTTLPQTAERPQLTLADKTVPARSTIGRIGSRRLLWGGALSLATLLLTGSLAWWFLHPSPPGYVVLKDLEPLLVKNGESKKLGISIERHDFTGAVELIFQGVPRDIELPATATIPSRQDRIEVEVLAKKTAAPETRKITVRASQSRLSKEFDLTVVRWRPEWQMVPQAKLRTIDGKNYYDLLDVVKGKLSIRFLLIPKGEKNETFYIMENKVSVQQFQQFVQEHRDFVKYDCWTRGAVAGEQDLRNADEQHPVMRVHVEDAQSFARWLGGDLPTPEQWDKAAGRYEPNRGEGPYRGTWDSNDKTAIAVNREQEGPMEVGTATKDISLFGCRDMAGNGREWTRNLFVDVNSRTVPIDKPTKFDRVILRGASYSDPAPLRFRALDEPHLRGIEAQPYDKPDPSIGFRVVLEDL